MSSKYFYLRPSRVYGPVSSTELRRLVKSGRITPDALIAKNGTSVFRIAGEIDGLEFCEAQSHAPIVPFELQPSAAEEEELSEQSFQEALELAPPREFPSDPLAEIEQMADAAAGRSRRRRAEWNVGLIIAILLGAPTGWAFTQLPPVKASVRQIENWIVQRRIERARNEAESRAKRGQRVELEIDPAWKKRLGL